MSTDSSTPVEESPRKMTADEYSTAVAKWYETYYAWNISYLTYYNTMLINTFIQQVPIFIGANLLTTTSEVIPVVTVDPLADIRNARLKVASAWRRILAEAIDFILLHTFKIFLITFLAHYLHVIDANQISLNRLISTLIFDENISFPVELFCIELGYLVFSVAVESYFLARSGATPGKRLLRLRVLKCDHLQVEANGDVTVEPGTVLDNAAAITRSAFKALMATFLFPAVLVSILTAQNRQTSYDMAANALVVELNHQ